MDAQPLPVQSSALQDPASHALIRKVLWRLIPFCMLCYILNYLDRVNVSIAKIQMEQPNGGVPGFKDAFATGVSIFFLGYCLFEVPSNLVQERVGPRRWMARIMISWGLISMAFMFTRGPVSFYWLRFLLGVAEAGFFPGIILYFSYWVPHEYRARASAIFLTSTALAGVIGNPLGGFILYFVDKHHTWLAAHHLPLQSWQWLFLLEGLPTVLLGVFVLFYLTDTPAGARWLTADERTRLTAIMTHERENHPGHHTKDLIHAFASPHTWILSILYGLSIYGFYILNYFVPTIIKATLHFGADTPDYLQKLYIGLFSAIPFSAAVIGMVLIGRHSDRRNERKFHLAFACLLMMLGLAFTGVSPRFFSGSASTFAVVGGLSLGAVGAFGIFGPFWAMPPQLLTGTAAAAAFAIINSIGNFVGGFLSPLGQEKLSQEHALLLAAAFALSGAILAVLAPIPRHVAVKEFSEAPIAASQ